MTHPKPTASPKKASAAAQTDKFKTLARQLECDDSEAAFEKAVKKVAKAKPEKPAQ